MRFGLKMALEMLQYGYSTLSSRTRRIMKYVFWTLISLVLILLAVMVGVSLDVNSQSNDIVAQVASGAGVSIFCYLSLLSLRCLRADHLLGALIQSRSKPTRRDYILVDYRVWTRIHGTRLWKLRLRDMRTPLRTSGCLYRWVCSRHLLCPSNKLIHTSMLYSSSPVPFASYNPLTMPSKDSPMYK